MRREWRQRYLDHDGFGEDEGGIERWLRLTDALGLPRDYVISTRGLLPGTRFAVEAYLNFVRDRTLLEGIASSLTELFAPSLHSERIEGMLANYPFIDDAMMGYFRRRLAQAPRDVNFALNYVKAHARTQEAQQAAIDALIFKTEVLWAQLDALYFSYVEPRFVPPGAFQP
jgi:coenzyme PQQ biosynthesis protein C